jgi:hypothetical protein
MDVLIKWRLANEITMFFIKLNSNIYDARRAPSAVVRKSEFSFYLVRFSEKLEKRFEEEDGPPPEELIPYVSQN